MRPLALDPVPALLAELDEPDDWECSCEWCRAVWYPYPEVTAPPLVRPMADAIADAIDEALSALASDEGTTPGALLARLDASIAAWRREPSPPAYEALPDET